MRDLTLRSADSFGMFHLMRLLCDGEARAKSKRACRSLAFGAPRLPLTLSLFFSLPEYMFFLLEKAVMSGHCPQVVHQPDGGEERRVGAVRCGLHQVCRRGLCF